MVKLESIEQRHIEFQSQQLKISNKGILERTIHAFVLLDRLSASGLDFIFKGGTCLLLHMASPKRLSVDIDIVCGVDRTEFDKILSSAVCHPPFTGFELLDRGASRLPKRRHYKFKYPAKFGGRDDLYVLLDVVEEKNVIKNVITKEVAHSFLLTDAKLNTVVVPTIDALLGDKLTAFAPNTIGIPLDQDRSHQVFKQLFDIAQLFDHVADFEVVKDSYFTTAVAEAGYRGMPESPPEVALHDTIQTAFDICCIDLPKRELDPALDQLLRRGVGQLDSDLINGVNFDHTAAKIAAAKTAHIACLLLDNPGNVDLQTTKFSLTPELKLTLKNHVMTKELRILDKMKHIPEAYWRWYEIDRSKVWQPK